MPTAFVDLDALRRNAERVSEATGDKNVRVVTKSVRSIGVLRRILDMSSDFEGVMAFSAREAAYLADHGFDDVLVAYPVWNRDGIRAACRADTEVALMVNSSGHVDRVAEVSSEEEVTVPLCIDVDMSVDYPGLRF